MAGPFDWLLSGLGRLRSGLRRGRARSANGPPLLPAPPVVVAAPTPPKPARSDGFFAAFGRRVDSLLNALSGMGGAYDKGAVGRPDLERVPLTYAELCVLYRDNGYAARWVDLPPADATRKGWRVKDASGDQDPLATETKRLAIPVKFREGLQWGRLYGGGWVFIVCDEDIPAQYNRRTWLEQPLDLRRVKRVLSLHALDTQECRPYAYDGDARSKRFREARLYTVSPNAQALSSWLASGQIVHHTRLLYFPGRVLPAPMRAANGGVDDSVLQGVWDQIRHITEIDQAAALLAQELNVGALTMDFLEAASTEDQYAALNARMQLIASSKSLINMILLGKGETFENKAANVSGFEALASNARSALCATSGAPEQTWFGTAPGGLNADGESHRKLWSNQVASFQNDRLLEPLTWLYTVLYAQKEGPTQGQIPDEWSIEFLPLDELTETETAALRKTNAESDALVVQAGILPAEHVAKSRYGPTGYSNDILPYDPDAEAAAMEAEAAAATEAALGAGDPGAILQPGAETEDAAAPVDEAVARLAEKMTAHQIERCEHGSNNRCRICGIERVRDLAEGPDGRPLVGPDGAPVWKVEWRPIYSVVATAPAGTAMPARTDAADAADAADPLAPPKVGLTIPLPASAIPAWQEAVRAAEDVVGVLTPGKMGPHVTLLFLGPTPGSALPEVAKAATAMADQTSPMPLRAEVVRAFDAGPDGVPVYMPITEPWALRALNDGLLRALAHVISAPQHAVYVPHITLGYAPALDEAQRAALAELVVPRVEFVAARVDLVVGNRVIGTAAFSRVEA